MRLFLLLWAAPVTLFGAWYVLSANDLVFSREFHDLLFATYGRMLGMDPGEVAPMMFRAVAVDGSILLAIIGFRRRRAIVAFVRARVTARPVPFTAAALPACRERPAG